MSTDTYAMEATFLAIANLEEAPCEMRDSICGSPAEVRVVHIACGFAFLFCGPCARLVSRELASGAPYYCDYCRARNLRPEDVRFTNI